jgi:3-mercaptopyruvate sulfurtransferase SseA
MCCQHSGHTVTRMQSWAEFESELSLERYATLDDVSAAAEAADTQIVDARSHEQYIGKVKRAKHGGHVPSAISRTSRYWMRLAA